MRPSREIVTEIEATAKRLQGLQVEFINARLSERDEIVRLFQSGLRLREIGQQTGNTTAAVQGVLYRAGMTLGGRDKIVSKLDDDLRARLRRQRSQSIRPVSPTSAVGGPVSPLANGPSGAPVHSLAGAPLNPPGTAARRSRHS